MLPSSGQRCAVGVDCREQRQGEEVVGVQRLVEPEKDIVQTKHDARDGGEHAQRGENPGHDPIVPRNVHNVHLRRSVESSTPSAMPKAGSGSILVVDLFI